MNLRDNMLELTQFEVMKRCLLKVPPWEDPFADPGVNFDLCCRQVGDKIEKEVMRLDDKGQREYFLAKSLEAMEWCRDHQAPADLSIQVMQWRGKLTN